MCGDVETNCSLNVRILKQVNAPTPPPARYYSIREHWEQNMKREETRRKCKRKEKIAKDKRKIESK
jgi:hypothetical protein